MIRYDLNCEAGHGFESWFRSSGDYDLQRKKRLVECPIYTGGLGVDLADYFDEIARKTHHVQFSRNILKDLQVKPIPRKLNAGEDPKQNAIYIVSSGMMVARTPSYTLASGLLGQARNTIGFVGYCDPDTPGGQLLATHPNSLVESTFW